MTRIERVRAVGVGYIAKYASKQFHGDVAGGDGIPFPRGARLSGGGGLGLATWPSTDGGWRLVGLGAV